MKRRILLGLLAVLMLAGCSEKALFDKFIPKQEAQFAQHYLALLQARDFSSIESIIGPNLKKPHLREQLDKIAAVFPAGKPVSVKTVGAQMYADGDNGARRVSLSFEYQYPAKWLLASVAMRESGHKTVVTGMRVHPIPDSLEHSNRFTFAGKGATQYIAFAASVIVLLLTLTTLVLCIRTPIPKYKWLWILFIVFGFAQVFVNWTTGHLGFYLVSVQLFSFGAIKASPYSPWLVSVSLPVGAIIFLSQRKQFLQQATSSATESTAA